MPNPFTTTNLCLLQIDALSLVPLLGCPLPLPVAAASAERDDVELAAAAVAGERQALALLVERHYDTIYRLAYKWSGLKADAQDIAQEACVKLVRKLHTFRGRSAFRTWLYRLVLNTAKDAARRRTRRQQDGDRFEAEHLAASSHTGAEASLAAARIMAAIERLPLKQKQAGLLVWAEGFSHREAAGVLGCREATVSWHLHQARKTLKSQLEMDP